MKEVTEEIILEAMEMAHKYIKEICEFQLKFAKQFTVKKIEADILKPSDEAVKAVSAVISEDAVAVTGKTKKEVKEKIHEMEAKILKKYAKKIEDEVFSEGELKEVLNNMLEKKMRKNILEKEERLDGRKLDEIRPITIIPDPLPRTHGSAIFQRGETMALTITTLGGPGDAQIVDTMVEDITKRYFHHYHFPPFATGDIKMLRGPGRREIGHGDLAERALVPMLPTKEEFPYTMWLVSEIIRCNGSSSMASVCGSTLSLMCAGVPIKKPVAGIAMGLVTDTESKSYKILTDIQGMEDFAGDMDFKVAGTVDGITALQMDIKIKGLSIKVMKEAMERAKQARLAILEKMIEVVPEPRKHLSKYAPLIMNLKIDPEMIRIVIGKGGETIQGITKECGVEMDISDEGLVTITAPDQEKGNKALEWVKRITYVPEVGETFEGKVTRILEFGAFVEFLPGKEGLVHISELSKERVGRVEDVVKIGDTIKVKLMKIDEQGRYNLSHKAVVSASPKPPISAGKLGASHGGGGPGTLRKV
jgi:polyribonucleotide nucleotidyltransferase